MAGSIWQPLSSQVPASPEVSPHLFTPGTAAAPGLSFTGDTNNGIYSPGADQTAVATVGIQRVVVDAVGNVFFSGSKIAPGIELVVPVATTVDLGSYTTNCLNFINGGSVSSFGTNYKGLFFIRHTSAVTYVNSGNIVCPGNVNLSAASGSVILVVPKATAGVSDGWVIASYSLSTGSGGGSGATGAAGNFVFYENDQTVTGAYTLTANKNAGSFGPITIADNVIVTVPTGAVWSIV